VQSSVKAHLTRSFPDFDFVLPFFGLTVIENAHVPFFSAFTEDPEMRQIFDELLVTRADNLAPVGTTSLR